MSSYGYFIYFGFILKLLDSFQKSCIILNQIGNMTAYKLSLGQQNSIKTSSIELNLKRNKALDFSSNVAVSEGQIQMPNLCNVFGVMNSAACNNLVLTTQVLTNILSLLKLV